MILGVCLFLNCLIISPEIAETIAQKIWQNECGASVEGLTHWGQGENFPSLGIGHFIWYPTGKKEKFEETFPTLLTFIKSQGVLLPKWLNERISCPWNSRDEFYAAIHSPEMKSLRQFLIDTKSLQAVFIANRLETVVEKIVQYTAQKKKVRAHFEKLSKEARGLYAMIDYLNFKGSGLVPTERYQGEGWGLCQVLESIPESSKEIIFDFVQAAKSVLKRRVDLSPPERNEKQWLKGWNNRLDTY